MTGITYRIICLLFAVILGVEQAWLTWISKAMYVPPEDIIWCAGVLFGGLVGKTWMERSTGQPSKPGDPPTVTPEQTAKLIELLSKIADALSAPKSYTITGAADWPLLLVVSGILGIMIAFVAALIKVMWTDLRLSMRDGRTEWKEAVAQAKKDEEKEHDLLWSALRDCQGDCCPPRIGHVPETGRHERRSTRGEMAVL